MPNAVIDDLAAVVAYLRADSEVAALVGTRVYGDELPDSQAALMPRKAIVVNDAGLGSGGGALGMSNRSNIPISNTTKDLRCYGETFAEARRVWNAAYGALKALGQAAGTYKVTIGGQKITLISAVPAAPATTREPQVDWPLTFGVFNLLAKESAT